MKCILEVLENREKEYSMRFEMIEFALDALMKHNTATCSTGLGQSLQV